MHDDQGEGVRQYGRGLSAWKMLGDLLRRSTRKRAGLWRFGPEVGMAIAMKGPAKGSHSGAHSAGNIVDIPSWCRDRCPLLVIAAP